MSSSAIAGRRRLRLLLLSGLFLGLAAYAWFGPTVVRQLRRMSMAREHAPVVEALLRADKAFEHIQVGAGSGGGGVFLVAGSVASQEDLQRLQSLVARTMPPVEVFYVVRVK